MTAPIETLKGVTNHANKISTNKTTPLHGKRSRRQTMVTTQNTNTMIAELMEIGLATECAHTNHRKKSYYLMKRFVRAAFKYTERVQNTTVKIVAFLYETPFNITVMVNNESSFNDVSDIFCTPEFTNDERREILINLKITGEATKVAEVFNFIKADEPDKDGKFCLFDLNKVIPMPSSLDIVSSSTGEDGSKYLLGLSGNIVERTEYMRSQHFARMKEMEQKYPKMFEDAIKLGKQRLHNIAEYGHSDWYTWRIENWGTKWNTYEYRQLDENTIEFQTAWSGIPDAVAKVAAKFSNVQIEYKYADENISCNVGHFLFRGEECTDLSPEDGSPEAWALVFDLGVAIEEDYVQQPDGTWKYREDDEE